MLKLARVLHAWCSYQMAVQKEIEMLYDLFKAFDQIESSHKSEFFSPKRLMFLNAFETFSELPSNISTRKEPSPDGCIHFGGNQEEINQG